MLTKTLLRIGSLLKEHSIPYMVIGGYAVLYHGESRFTEDIDIVLGFDTDKLEKVVNILIDEFKLRTKNVDEFVNRTNVLPLVHKKYNVKVDLMFSFIEFERNAIKNAVEADLDGEKIKIVKAEDLIIYKLLAGRTKDLDDAKNVLQYNIEDLDIQEIDQSVQQLSEMVENEEIYQNWQSIKDSK